MARRVGNRGDRIAAELDRPIRWRYPARVLNKP
jgi:hypothetical protein